MNNFILKNLIGNTIYWDVRDTIREKVNARLDDRGGNEIEWPFANQMHFPTNHAIRKAIKKKNE